MSIKPQFAEAILDGRKRVEFRKRRLAPDVTTVLVYTTMPTGLVTGTFEISGYDVGSPTKIWELHKAHGGIARSGYRAYFHGAPTAVGIRVGRVSRLDTPLRLEDVSPGLRAPQSFIYLDSSQVADLVATQAGTESAPPSHQAA